MELTQIDRERGCRRGHLQLVVHRPRLLLVLQSLRASTGRSQLAHEPGPPCRSPDREVQLEGLCRFPHCRGLESETKKASQTHSISPRWDTISATVCSTRYRTDLSLAVNPLRRCLRSRAVNRDAVVSSSSSSCSPSAFLSSAAIER